MEQEGKNTADGFAKGLLDSQAAVADAVTDYGSIGTTIVNLILATAAALPTKMGELGTAAAAALLAPFQNLPVVNIGIGVRIAESVSAELDEDTDMEESGQESVEGTQTAMELAAGTAGFAAVGALIIDELVTSLDGLYDQMRGCGENAIEGLINGINSKRTDAQNALNTLANSLSKTFKVTMKIASPSKLFYEYGVNTIQGYVNAIRDKLGAARAVMRDFSDVAAGYEYPTAYDRIRETSGAPRPAAPSKTVNVTQQIYAQKQSPSEMLREAKWLQQRAVMIGV